MPNYRLENYIGFCKHCHEYVMNYQCIRASQIPTWARNHKSVKRTTYKTDPLMHVICNRKISVRTPIRKSNRGSIECVIKRI